MASDMTWPAIDKNGRRLQKEYWFVLMAEYSVTLWWVQQLCWTWNVDGWAFIRKCDALSKMALNIWTVAPNYVWCRLFPRRRERELFLWVWFLLGLQQAWFRSANTFRAALRRGPSEQLPGAPAYKGRKDVAEIIGNVVPVNSIFHTRKKNPEN
jgi:hypothetical protein